MSGIVKAIGSLFGGGKTPKQQGPSAAQIRAQNEEENAARQQRAGLENEKASATRVTRSRRGRNLLEFAGNSRLKTTLG